MSSESIYNNRDDWKTQENEIQMESRPRRVYG